MILSRNLAYIGLTAVDFSMLLRSSSAPALNPLVRIQPEPELNARIFVQLIQLYVDGKWIHHDVQPRFGRTLSEADLRNPLSHCCTRRLGLRRGSVSFKLSRKLSTEIFMNNGLLDESLGEKFEDCDTQISIAFQSAGDPHEKSGEKNMAAIGTHGGEGSFVSGRRNEDLMGGGISKGNKALGCDGAVVGCRTETGFINGDIGDEDGGGFSGGGRYGKRVGGFRSDSNNTDAYYKKMLQADPGNPLLLANYARFLQEVQHDLEKAEEYYGRAILASPGDGDVLSLYANIIWDVHKDAPRAQSHYDQAIEAAPDDCNVLGSYAHFLWNAEDDEEIQDASQQQNMAPPTYFGTATTSAT